MKVLRLLFILVFALGINLSEAKNITKGRHKKSQPKIYALNQILKGSVASRLKQNQKADEEGLERIKDDEELQGLKDRGLLVTLPENEFVGIDERLDQKNRWCRPWVRDFLLKESQNTFHGKFQINSAVRTIEDQERLMRINPNAVTPYGPLATSHIRGSTIDITKKNLSPKAVSWLRKKLIDLERANLIEAIEERNQSVFHVMVFKKYSEK